MCGCLTVLIAYLSDGKTDEKKKKKYIGQPSECLERCWDRGKFLLLPALPKFGSQAAGMKPK